MMSPQKKLTISISTLMSFVVLNHSVFDSTQVVIVDAIIFILLLAALNDYKLDLKLIHLDRIQNELSSFFTQRRDDERNEYQYSLNHELHACFNSKDYTRQ